MESKPHPEIPTPTWRVVNLDEPLPPGHPSHDAPCFSTDSESYIIRHEEAAQAERARLAAVLEKQTRSSTPKREGIAPSASSTPKRTRDKALNSQFPGPLEAWKLMQEVKKKYLQTDDEESKHDMTLAERRRGIPRIAEPLECLANLETVLTKNTTRLRGMYNKSKLMESDTNKTKGNPASIDPRHASANRNGAGPAHKKLRLAGDAPPPPASHSLQIALEESSLAQAEASFRAFSESSAHMLSAFKKLLEQMECPIPTPLTFAAIQKAMEEARVAPERPSAQDTTCKDISELVRRTIDADKYPGVAASFNLKEGYMLDGIPTPYSKRRRKRKRQNAPESAPIDDGNLRSHGFSLDPSVLRPLRPSPDSARDPQASTPQQQPPSRTPPARSRNVSPRRERIYPALQARQPFPSSSANPVVPELQLSDPAVPPPPRTPDAVPAEERDTVANMAVVAGFAISSGHSTPAPSTPSTVRQMRPEDAIHELDRHHQQANVKSFLSRIHDATLDESEHIDGFSAGKRATGKTQEPIDAEGMLDRNQDLDHGAAEADEDLKRKEEQTNRPEVKDLGGEVGEKLEKERGSAEIAEVAAGILTDDEVTKNGNTVHTATVSRKNTIPVASGLQSTRKEGDHHQQKKLSDKARSSSGADLHSLEIRSDGLRGGERGSGHNGKASVGASVPGSTREAAKQPTASFEMEKKNEYGASGSVSAAACTSTFGSKSGADSSKNDAPVGGYDEDSIVVHDSSESIVPSSSGRQGTSGTGKTEELSEDGKKDGRLASSRSVSVSQSDSVNEDASVSKVIVLD